MNFLLSSGDPTGVGPEICLKFVSKLLDIQKRDNALLSLKNGIIKGDILISIVGHQNIFTSLIQKYHLPLNFVKTEQYAFLQHQNDPQIKIDFIHLEFSHIIDALSKKNMDLEAFYEKLREYGSGKFSLQILDKVTNLLKLKKI